MKVSTKIAELTVDRYRNFETPFHSGNAKQAPYSFTGDVYRHMRLSTWSEPQISFAQETLRILSGLYGYLRPLDLIQPYRLEMKTRLSTARGKDLYRFWGDRITRLLERDLQNQAQPILINLASLEYAKAVRLSQLTVPVITISFKEVENGQARVIAIFAKWARGLMADYIVQNRITDPENLKRFQVANYSFSAADSSTTDWVFTRPRPE